MLAGEVGDEGEQGTDEGGGEQERLRRAGMENVAGIVGFGAAAATLASTLDGEEARAQAVRLLEAA